MTPLLNTIVKEQVYQAIDDLDLPKIKDFLPFYSTPSDYQPLLKKLKRLVWHWSRPHLKKRKNNPLETVKKILQVVGDFNKFHISEDIKSGSRFLTEMECSPKVLTDYTFKKYQIDPNNPASFRRSEPTELPAEMLFQIFGFLDLNALCAAEQVNRLWRCVINSRAQHLWKQLCAAEQIPNPEMKGQIKKRWNGIIGPKPELLQKTKKNPAPEIEGQIDYRSLAISPRYDLLLRSPWTYHNIIIDISPSSYWKRSLPEMPIHQIPFWEKEKYSSLQIHEAEVVIQVELKESNTSYFQRKLFKRTFPKHFYTTIPLRLLMNPDNSYLNTGNKIHAIIGNKTIIFTCTYQPHWTIGRNVIFIKDFRQGLKERIDAADIEEDISIFKPKISAANNWVRRENGVFGKNLSSPLESSFNYSANFQHSEETSTPMAGIQIMNG